MMTNITGHPVTGKDYLSTRLFLVKDLRTLARKTSVIIEAPRRFGKTSVIKELERQVKLKPDETDINVIFFELEAEETINGFCFTFFKELLDLFIIKKAINDLSGLLGDLWNVIASRVGKVGLPQFDLELREKTKDYDFAQWKAKIEPLVFRLNALDKKTIIVFDEFPDMLMNFKSKRKEKDSYKEAVDRLTAWLRTLRQRTDGTCKYSFVYCGSINLRQTLQDMGLGKRINDLETFRIPHLKVDEAKQLIGSLMMTYDIEIEPKGIEFMVEKIADGSPYYGQILFKPLRDAREKKFSLSQVKGIYDNMLRGGDHDLKHFHSRLKEYLPGEQEKQCSFKILSHLCNSPVSEKEMYDGYVAGICSFNTFQTVVNRLIHEGYIMRDSRDEGVIRFVSPLLRDWWACNEGVQ